MSKDGSPRWKYIAEHLRVDDDYWRYATRCRLCGFINVWAIAKRDNSYGSLYRHRSTDLYHCVNCDLHTAQEFVGLTPEPDAPGDEIRQ